MAILMAVAEERPPTNDPAERATFRVTVDVRSTIEGIAIHNKLG